MNTKDKIDIYPKYILRIWTHSSIHCYERRCKCKNCIYENLLESTECLLKIAVILLIRKIGLPTQEQIRNYYIKERQINE